VNVRLLSDLERRALEEACTNKASCDPIRAAETDSTADAHLEELEKIIERFLRRGLLSDWECDTCSDEAFEVRHTSITTYGRLALRVDANARTLVST
jgi:hypothetical protein